MTPLNPPPPPILGSLTRCRMCSWWQCPNPRSVMASSARIRAGGSGAGAARKTPPKSPATNSKARTTAGPCAKAARRRTTCNKMMGGGGGRGEVSPKWGDTVYIYKRTYGVFFWGVVLTWGLSSISRRALISRRVWGGTPSSGRRRGTFFRATVSPVWGGGGQEMTSCSSDITW